MKKKRTTGQGKLALKKETIRALQARTLTADELAHIAGGWCVKPSTICTTSDD